MANLKLLGAVSGYTELAAADNAVPTVFVLPAADGTAGQVLSTNGSGTLQFTTVAGGSSNYNLPTASAQTLGGVRVDGTTITINGSAISLGGSVTVGTGSVTSVSGTGTVSGITLSGTVTTSGSLTLGGTLDLSSPPAIGGTTPAAITGTTITATNYVGISGGTF